MSRFTIADVLDADERMDIELPDEQDALSDAEELTDDEEDAADILLQDQERDRVRGLNSRSNLNWTFDTTSEIDYGYEDN
jgi:hypothetical protein